MMTCDNKSGGMPQATCSCGTGWLPQTLPPPRSSLQTSCQRRPCRRQWLRRPLHKRCLLCVASVVSGALAASDQTLQLGKLCHHMGGLLAHPGCVPTRAFLL